MTSAPASVLAPISQVSFRSHFSGPLLSPLREPLRLKRFVTLTQVVCCLLLRLKLLYDEQSEEEVNSTQPLRKLSLCLQILSPALPKVLSALLRKDIDDSARLEWGFSYPC